MYALRRWSVRHAGMLSGIYAGFERLLTLVRSAPGAGSATAGSRAPVAAVERGVKGLLFDCRMCGQCALGSTGLSCPMNCPKNLRNGPCGGAAPTGSARFCRRCAASGSRPGKGSRRMAGGDAILAVQKPVDHRLWGRSAWLGVLRARPAAGSGLEP